MPKVTSNSRGSRSLIPYKKESTKSNDLLLDILEKPDTEIEIISTYSLSGFIFKISNNGKSYIMKIVVISPEKEKLLTICMKNIPELVTYNVVRGMKIIKYQDKVTETQKQFVNEIQTQYFIYFESKKGSRNPICPKIVYNKIYDNELSKSFLDKMRNKIEDNKHISIDGYLYEYGKLTKKTVNSSLKINLFNSLTDELKKNKDYQLGIILMEEFENSITFEYYLKKKGQMEGPILSHIYSKIIYLFLIVRIINYDMHEGNILIKNDDVTLIDFGRIIKFIIQSNDDSNPFTENEKEYVNKLINDLIEEFFEINSLQPRKEQIDDDLKKKKKTNFIFKIMNIINLLFWIAI